MSDLVGNPEDHFSCDEAHIARLAKIEGTGIDTIEFKIPTQTEMGKEEKQACS